MWAWRTVGRHRFAVVHLAPPSTPASRFATFRSPPATPTHAPPVGRTSIVTPPTPSSPSSRAADHPLIASLYSRPQVSETAGYMPLYDGTRCRPAVRRFIPGGKLRFSVTGLAGRDHCGEHEHAECDQRHLRQQPTDARQRPTWIGLGRSNQAVRLDPGGDTARRRCFNARPRVDVGPVGNGWSAMMNAARSMCG